MDMGDANNAKPVVDYTVDEDSEFVCPICLHLLTEPIQTPECGHLFCRKCLTEWINVHEKTVCPACNETLDVDYLRIANKPDKRVERAVLLTKVICSSCSHDVAFKDWPEHAENCLAPCPFQPFGCQEMVNVNGPSVHESVAAQEHLSLVAAKYVADFISFRQKIAQVREEAMTEIAKTRDEAKKEAKEDVREEAMAEIARVREEAKEDVARVREDAMAEIAKARAEAKKETDEVVAQVREEAMIGISRARDEAKKEANIEIARVREEATETTRARDEAKKEADKMTCSVNYLPKTEFQCSFRLLRMKTDSGMELAFSGLMKFYLMNYHFWISPDTSDYDNKYGLYFHICKGEFDKCLAWPFRANLRVRLSEAATDTVLIDDEVVNFPSSEESDHRQRPKKSSNTGWGFPYVLSEITDTTDLSIVVNFVPPLSDS